MRITDRFICALLIAAYCAPSVIICMRLNSSTPWISRLLSDTLFELIPSGRSDQCTRDLLTYQNNVNNLTLWAVKMFDASSKGSNGLLSGENYYLGHYDQCLSIHVPDIRVSGRYTIVQIHFLPTKYPNYKPLGIEDYKEPDPKSKVWIGTKPSSDRSKTKRNEIYWALCLPNSCSPDRLKSILEKQFSQIPGINVSVKVDPTMSSISGDEEPLTRSHYIFFSIVGLNLVLVIIGTWYDFTVLKKSEIKRGILKNLLKPFSMATNARRLLKKNDNFELSVIDGLKVFTMCNVILGHRMIILLGNPISNPDYSEQNTKTIWYNFLNSTLMIETFFVISGFLTYYGIIREINRTKTFNIMVLLIYRWLRIVPVYASLIAIYLFVLPYLGNGPLWKSIILKETERCQISWWSNLAFLNNYVSTENLCVIPSWYLACDMHFFLIGSLLTCAAWKSRKVGVSLMTSVLVLSVYIPSKMIYHNNYWGSLPIYIDAIRDLNNEPNFVDMYIKSHNRATTYLVGLLMAVVYEKLNEQDYKFSKKQLFLSMIVCAILGNLVFLSTYILYIPGKPYNPWTHIIFFSFTRIIWALIIGITIIAHGTTGLGFFSDLLGHTIFSCLGKLTFCVYLYQEIIQFVTIGTMRSPNYVSHALITWMTGGDIIVTYIIAIVVYFMVESPCEIFLKNIIQLLIKGHESNVTEEKNMEVIKEKESNHSYPGKT